MDLLSLLRPKRKAAPAKLWRNWYRAEEDFNFYEVGFKKAGEIWPSAHAWPSRDIAQTKARLSMDLWEMAAEMMEGMDR